MNLDNPLLLGVALIAAGLALALLAYAVLLNRPAGEPETEADAWAAEPASPGDSQADEPAADEGGMPSDKAQETLPTASDEPSPPTPTPEPPVVTAAPEPAPSAPVPETTVRDRRRIQVAMLLRDEVTGQLIVQVDDREYLSESELLDESHRRRLEYAASDLARWLSGAGDAERLIGRGREGTAPRPESMIDQINEILKLKLTEAESSRKAVRLVEGAGGIVRVFVGVQGYDFDEVPDPEVRAIIREAVAEWEALQ
jgi:hypothetical protein